MALSVTILVGGFLVDSQEEELTTQMEVRFGLHGKWEPLAMKEVATFHSNGTGDDKYGTDGEYEEFDCDDLEEDEKAAVFMIRVPGAGRKCFSTYNDIETSTMTNFKISKGAGCKDNKKRELMLMWAVSDRCIRMIQSVYASLKPQSQKPEPLPNKEPAPAPAPTSFNLGMKVVNCRGLVDVIEMNPFVVFVHNGARYTVSDVIYKATDPDFPQKGEYFNVPFNGPDDMAAIRLMSRTSNGDVVVGEVPVSYEAIAGRIGNKSQAVVRMNIQPCDDETNDALVEAAHRKGLGIVQLAFAPFSSSHKAPTKYTVEEVPSSALLSAPPPAAASAESFNLGMKVVNCRGLVDVIEMNPFVVLIHHGVSYLASDVLKNTTDPDFPEKGGYFNIPFDSSTDTAAVCLMSRTAQGDVAVGTMDLMYEAIVQRMSGKKETVIRLNIQPLEDETNDAIVDAAQRKGLGIVQLAFAPFSSSNTKLPVYRAQPSKVRQSDEKPVTLQKLEQDEAPSPTAVVAPSPKKVEEPKKPQVQHEEKEKEKPRLPHQPPPPPPLPPQQEGVWTVDCEIVKAVGIGVFCSHIALVNISGLFKADLATDFAERVENPTWKQKFLNIAQLDTLNHSMVINVETKEKKVIGEHKILGKGSVKISSSSFRDIPESTVGFSRKVIVQLIGREKASLEVRFSFWCNKAKATAEDELEKLKNTRCSVPTITFIDVSQVTSNKSCASGGMYLVKLTQLGKGGGVIGESRTQSVMSTNSAPLWLHRFSVRQEYTLAEFELAFCSSHGREKAENVIGTHRFFCYANSSQSHINVSLDPPPESKCKEVGSIRFSLLSSAVTKIENENANKRAKYSRPFSSKESSEGEIEYRYQVHLQIVSAEQLIHKCAVTQREITACKIAATWGSGSAEWENVQLDSRGNGMGGPLTVRSFEPQCEIQQVLFTVSSERVFMGEAPTEIEVGGNDVQFNKPIRKRLELLPSDEANDDRAKQISDLNKLGRTNFGFLEVELTLTRFAIPMFGNLLQLVSATPVPVAGPLPPPLSNPVTLQVSFRQPAEVKEPFSTAIRATLNPSGGRHHEESGSLYCGELTQGNPLVVFIEPPKGSEEQPEMIELDATQSLSKTFGGAVMFSSSQLIVWLQFEWVKEWADVRNPLNRSASKLQKTSPRRFTMTMRPLSAALWSLQIGQPFATGIEVPVSVLYTSRRRIEGVTADGADVEVPPGEEKNTSELFPYLITGTVPSDKGGAVTIFGPVVESRTALRVNFRWGDRTLSGDVEMDMLKKTGSTNVKGFPIIWTHGSGDISTDEEMMRRKEEEAIWRATQQDTGLPSPICVGFCVQTCGPTDFEPPRTFASSLTRLGSEAIMIGGLQEVGVMNGQVHQYNSKAKKWITLSENKQSGAARGYPTMRHGHVAAAWGKNKIVVHGGIGPGGFDPVAVSEEGLDDSLLKNGYLEDAWVFTIRRGEDIVSFAKVEPEEPLPPREETLKTEAMPLRWRHAGVVHNDNLIVFGGNTIIIRETIVHLAKGRRIRNFAPEFELCEPLSLLDLKTGQWTTAATCGPGPQPRSGHSMTMIPDTNRCLLFGGKDANKHRHNDLFELNCDTLEWQEILPFGCVSPPPVDLHAAAMTVVEGSACLVVAGGRYGPASDKSLSMFMFCVETQFWREIDFAWSTPGPQRISCALLDVTPALDPQVAAAKSATMKRLPAQSAPVVQWLMLGGGHSSPGREALSGTGTHALPCCKNVLLHGLLDRNKNRVQLAVGAQLCRSRPQTADGLRIDRRLRTEGLARSGAEIEKTVKRLHRKIVKTETVRKGPAILVGEKKKAVKRYKSEEEEMEAGTHIYKTQLAKKEEAVEKIRKQLKDQEAEKWRKEREKYPRGFTIWPQTKFNTKKEEREVFKQLSETAKLKRQEEAEAERQRLEQEQEKAKQNARPLKQMNERMYYTPQEQRQLNAQKAMDELDQKIRTKVPRISTQNLDKCVSRLYPGPPSPLSSQKFGAPPPRPRPRSAKSRQDY